jgi:malate synthase
VRTNVSVGLRYLESWLRGVGAAAIDNLMEDAATAEISRAQLWQWLRHDVVTAELVREVIADEVEQHAEVGVDTRELFEGLVFAERFPEFLTLPAYDYLEGR